MNAPRTFFAIDFKSFGLDCTTTTADGHRTIMAYDIFTFATVAERNDFVQDKRCFREPVAARYIHRVWIPEGRAYYYYITPANARRALNCPI